MEPLAGASSTCAHLAAAAGGGGLPTLLHECQGWLLDLLERSDQPLKPSEIVSLAAQHGYNRRLVYRARRRLASAILDTHGRRHPHNAWLKSRH